jgi:hypothetical protein
VATKLKSETPVQMKDPSIRIWWPPGKEKESVFDLDAPRSSYCVAME